LPNLREALEIVDAHCHLDAEHFAEGAEPVIDRARAAGVIGFIVVGVGPDLGSAKHAIDLARRMPEHVGACVGVHPEDAATFGAALEDELRALAAAPEVVAVGEIGLDYHYADPPRRTQQLVFARLIAVARELRRPIVVHTRDAGTDTLEILTREGARDVGGIVHCFSEDRSFAARALDLGFDLSFSGIVTFKNARSVADVAVWAPSDRILVETDSPYLAPGPFRGKRCEPAYVVHTAAHVARLRGIRTEEFAAHTVANTERRFSKVFARPSRSPGKQV
jgi:TatD DNase family protein